MMQDQDQSRRESPDCAVTVLWIMKLEDNRPTETLQRWEMPSQSGNRNSWQRQLIN